jgi:hypothetical protein
MTQTVHYAQRVGTAPATVTMTLNGALGQQCPPIPGPEPVYHVPQPIPRGPDGKLRKKIEFFVPYATPAAFRGSGFGGLGVINQTDWWRTGRPYGLPGTQALFLPGEPPGTPGVGVPIRVPSYMSGRVFPPGYEGPQTLSGLGLGPDHLLQEMRRQAKLQITFLGIIAVSTAVGAGAMVAKEIRKRRMR